MAKRKCETRFLSAIHDTKPIPTQGPNRELLIEWHKREGGWSKAIIDPPEMIFYRLPETV